MNWSPLTRTLLVLTFVTGIVDAVSFVGLGQVFAAMQTGNVIFLGLGIGGTPGTHVLAPLIGLAAFLGGGGVGALLGERGLGTVIAVEAILLAAAALLAAIADPSPDTAAAYVLIAGLSLTMGMRNTVARRVGGSNLATTVLNLSFAPFAPTGSTLASESDMAVRVAALIAILLGALTGALLVKSSVALAIGVAAVVVALAAAVAPHFGRL